MNEPIDQRMRQSLHPHIGGAFPLYVIRLRGTQQDMGRRHGALTRAVPDVPSVSAHYADLHRRLILGTGGGDAAERVALTALQPLFSRALHTLENHRDPALRSRSRAFAEALGEDPDGSRFTGVMDLFQNVVSLAFNAGIPKIARRLALSLPPACSTLMAWGDATEQGDLIHARNFDFPGIGLWERRPTVVFCTPEDGLRYGFVTTLGADLPGITAFNEAGIVLTAHTRFHKDVRFRGTPIVDLGHEVVRRARTLADALSVVRELSPIASTWGLAISSAREGRSISVETSGTAVRPVYAEGDFQVCTNRYHHPSTQAGEIRLSAGFIASSQGRESLLRQHIAAGPTSMARARQILGSLADPEVPNSTRSAGAVLGQGCSVQSVVFNAAHQRVDVSVGPCPTGSGPWATVEWDWNGLEFEARQFDDPAPAHTAAATAHGHYVETTRLAEDAAPLADCRGHIERAVALQPRDPTYRFAAGLFAAKARDLDMASHHLAAALADERAPFVRAQIQLWASRVADARRDHAAARELRNALENQVRDLDPTLREMLRSEARADARRPFHAGGLAGIKIALEALDAG